MTQDATTQAEAKNGDQQSKGQDQVPLSDLIAVKRKLEAAETQAKVAAEARADEVETLTAKVEQLEADASQKGADTLGPEELEAARKAQFEAQRKLKEGQTALQKEKDELKVQRITDLKKALVAQYGVEESLLEGMTDPSEMELAAMKKAWEVLASSKPADFDISGAGATGGKPTQEMLEAMSIDKYAEQWKKRRETEKS